MDLKSIMPVWPDWPQPGVNFIDICGILNNSEAIRYVSANLTHLALDHESTSIVAIESRGFIFGSLVAYTLNVPLILIRKPNKLPGPIKTIAYETEYSTDELSIQNNAPLGDRPYIIDDLLATGGTLLAASQLVNKKNVRCGVVVNLSFLPGHKKLKDNNIECDYLVKYD